MILPTSVYIQRIRTLDDRSDAMLLTIDLNLAGHLDKAHSWIDFRKVVETAVMDDAALYSRFKEDRASMRFLKHLREHFEFLDVASEFDPCSIEVEVKHDNGYIHFRRQYTAEDNEQAISGRYDHISGVLDIDWSISKQMNTLLGTGRIERHNEDDSDVAVLCQVNVMFKSKTQGITADPESALRQFGPGEYYMTRIDEVKPFHTPAENIMVCLRDPQGVVVTAGIHAREAYKILLHLNKEEPS